VGKKFNDAKRFKFCCNSDLKINSVIVLKSVQSWFSSVK